MKRAFLSILLSLMTGINLLHAQETFSGYNVASEGAWCWFADPRAIHYENSDKSINMSYIGYIDVHGAVKATQYNWNTGEKNDVLVRSYFQPDDHNNPTFLVLPDERVLIIYSRHTDEAAFYYRVSLKPGDITQLGEEKCLKTNHNTTYPSPFILSDDPTHWYMCWRGISWHPTLARLTMPDENGDCQFDWGPYQMVKSNVSSGGIRPYAKYCSNGKDKIYFSFTSTHPDNECPNWLNFAVVNINKGGEPTLHDIQGNKLSTIKDGAYNIYKTSDFKTQHPAVVVDAPSNHRAWVWQVALDKNDNPRIAMVRITNDKSQHEYYYARWTGSAWALTDVCDGGGKFHPSNTERCYSGGEALDPANPGTMYVSRPTAGLYGNIHEIWKYTIDDGGKVTASEQITKNSKKGNVRPYILNGSENSPLRLSWMNGDYQYWIVCKNYPQGYPTAIMCDYDMDAKPCQTTGWTWSKTITMDPNNYKGTLATLGDITYSLNATSHKPELTIGGKTYTSSNQLYTSDAWQTCPATTDGKSYSSPLTTWNLTITYSVARKQLTTYRNGLIDQVIDIELADTPSEVARSCQNQTAVQQDIEKAVLESITLPATTRTDLVLPTKVNGENIAWTSSHANVLSNTGIYHAPAQQTTVTLTASTSNASRTFSVTVMPRDIKQNIRATVNKLDQTANTAAGFSSNTYGTLPEGTLKGLRSYTVLLKMNAKSLANAPRLYDLGGGSGNSLFLRANALSAGIKYQGGTTTMVNSSVALETGKDYALAVTFDADSKTTRIYINGLLCASGTDNQNEPYMIYEAVGDSRNYIGRTQWWDSSSEASKNVDFVGTISDFVLYDIALTRKEVCTAQGLPFDVGQYATGFVNGNFEDSYTVYKNPSSDRAIYQPKGWTVEYNTSDVNDLTALKSGDLYYSQFFASKAQPTDAGNQTLWIRQRWGASVLDYYQNVLLPAGDYVLSTDVFATDNSSNNHAYVYAGDKTLAATTLNAWQTMTMGFTSDGDEPVRIGLQANHVANEFICGFDNFKLYRLGDLDNDNTITIHDSSLLIDLLNNNRSHTAADVNKDGKLDKSDVDAHTKLVQSDE